MSNILTTSAFDVIDARFREHRKLGAEDAARLLDGYAALAEVYAAANAEIAGLQDTLAEAERLNADLEEQIDSLRGRTVGHVSENGNLVDHTPRGLSVQRSQGGTFIITALLRPDDGTSEHLLGVTSMYLKAEDIKYLAAFEHTAAMLTAPVAAQEEA